MGEKEENQMDRDTKLAVTLLRSDDELITDARENAPRGNSLAGAVLTRPLGPIGSRQHAEAAVQRALAVLAQES
jgi:hypothetical protein